MAIVNRRDFLQFVGVGGGVVFASGLWGSTGNTDANMVNPWSLAESPTGPIWVADNHTGVATVYGAGGKPLPPAPEAGEGHGLFGRLDALMMTTTISYQRNLFP